MPAAIRHRSTSALTLTATPLLLALAVPNLAACQGADETVSHEVETVAERFDHPWGMDFLPDGRLLVTERSGVLNLVDLASGEVAQVSGVPAVHAEGQGGLLDVALHPDFEDGGWLYLTWSGANEDGRTSTHVGRGRFDAETLALEDFETLYVAEPFQAGGQGHYGSRLAFDGENRLYVTVGDRQSRDFGPGHFSQDRSTDLGSTLRLEADGSIPDDNPFVDEAGVRDAIWSYGHRNVQAMAFHPQTGELWQAEHGESGGDEINLVEAGGNYGWPLDSYGVDYRTGRRFAPTPPQNPDSVDPVYHRGPGRDDNFPPSGLAFYEGDAFPQWRGHAFIGNLRHEYLGRFTVDGREVDLAERLLEGEGWRIRDVDVGPDDGYLYLLIDDTNVPLVRLRPAQE